MGILILNVPILLVVWRWEELVNISLDFVGLEVSLYWKFYVICIGMFDSGLLHYHYL